MLDADKERLDTLLYEVDMLVRCRPELVKGVVSVAKRLEAAAKRSARVGRLVRTPDWSDCPQSVQRELTSVVCEPFVTVMLGLATRKYRVSQTSMVLWWRRMVACGQSNVLTYFGWDGFHCDGIVVGNDLLMHCVKNQSMLANMTECLRSDTSVDFRIRELLGGLGMNSDVRSAWRKWNMANHPDKGGDPDKYIEVKLVYDEWLSTQKEASVA